MYKHYTQINQVEIDREDLFAMEKLVQQPEPPTEQYSGGWFDGLIGEKPRYPELKLYWSGYQQGLREYYAELAGIGLPNDC